MPPDQPPDPPERVIVTAPSMEVLRPGSAEVFLPKLVRVRDLDGNELFIWPPRDDWTGFETLAAASSSSVA